MVYYKDTNLSIRTDMSGQTVQTQRSSLIRVFTVCYSICIILTKYPKVWPLCLNFSKITAKIFGVQKFRNLTVFICSMSQRERLQAELEYMERLRGIKRRREVLPHRAQLDLLMGGKRMEFTERYLIITDFKICVAA